jgi:hypothetical protein
MGSDYSQYFQMYISYSQLFCSDDSFWQDWVLFWSEVVVLFLPERLASMWRGFIEQPQPLVRHDWLIDWLTEWLIVWLCAIAIFHIVGFHFGPEGTELLLGSSGEVAPSFLWLLEIVSSPKMQN